MTLNDRIRTLETMVKSLEARIVELTRQTQTSRKKPETIVGRPDLGKTTIPAPSSGTGLGRVYGGQENVLFNNAERARIPFGTQPDEPVRGYNKHGHSRFSGGALDINTLELVEYETNEEGTILGSDGQPLNKHCQQHWKNPPEIAKDGEVEKIGHLDISFDKDKRMWVTGSNEIDVERTYLVQYIWKKDGVEVSPDTEGAVREIKKDANENEMKSPLLYTLADTATLEGRNKNLNKSNVYWDADALTWRFYSVFKPMPEEEEE